MTIVKLTEKDYPSVLELSQYAFQYRITEKEMPDALDELNAHLLYGIYEEDTLAAKLHVVPFEVMLEQTTIKMGGIGAVATYPEYRRKGYVKALMTEALSIMKKEGFLLSMLHPFYVDFYRKFGWELFCDQRVSTLSKSELRKFGEAPGTVKRFKKEDHPEAMTHIYEVYASRYVGMVKRNRKRWLEAIYKEFNAAVYFNSNHEPSGYLLYKIKDAKMTVGEFIPLDQEARIGLWSFICQHDSMIQEFEMVTDVAEPLFFMLPEPRVKSVVKPYAMARIVNVAEFLKAYPFCWDNLRVPLTLKVSDELAPWNNVTVELWEGHMTVQGPERPNAQESNQVIELDIRTLTTVLMGYSRPSMLQQIGRLNGTSEAVQSFESIIGNRTPLILDFF